MASNPHFELVFKKMIKAGIQEESQNMTGTANKQGEVMEQELATPRVAKVVGANSPTNEQMRQWERIALGKKTNNKNPNVTPIKSPSDTTIYAPGLNKLRSETSDKNEIIERISNFVETIRLETQPAARRGSNGSSPQGIQNEEEVGCEKARRMVVDAEKFRASVEPPKGKEKVLVKMGKYSQLHIEVNSDSQGFKHEEVDDDEYFHLMCHVDGSLKSKIEKGGFVELDKLLPKKKMCQEDKRLEWVTKDGMTFLLPAQDREQRITNVKKWDQAFRVYAAIYCGANPLWAREVW